MGRQYGEVLALIYGNNFFIFKSDHPHRLSAFPPRSLNPFPLRHVAASSMAQRPPATLSGLPLELREAILSHVESPRTLEAATAAANCLAEALGANGGNFVIEEVLSRVIPQPLVPEAIAVLQARQTQSRDDDTLAQLQNDYFDSLWGGFPRRRWTLPEAVSVYDLHRLVQ